MRQEIVSRLEALLEQENVLKLNRDFNAILNDYRGIKFEDEKQQKVLEEKEDRGEEVASPSEEEVALVVANKELDKKIEDLIATYKEKKESQKKEQEITFELGLTQRKNIIAELEKLVSNEENIGKAFAEFNSLREKWNEAKPTFQDKYQKLQKKYSELSHDFYYNIEIYKEIKEHDLKKNLDLKLNLITELKETLEKFSGRELEVKIKAIHSRWDEIGPTYKEKWEEIKEEFWKSLKESYAKIQEYYKSKKENMKENLAFKKAVIEKIKELIADTPTSHKQWEEKSSLLLAIQDEWKKIGFVGKEENENLWKEFRSLYDSFFAQKKEFYEGLRGEHKGNKERKEALITQAEALNQSTDWVKTTNQMVKLQREWKKIGSAGKRHEQKLWNKFKATCDEFFNAKKGHFAEKDKEQVDNAKNKRALIQELNELNISGASKENLNQLLEFNKKFSAIGKVPLKDKEKIDLEFQKVYNNKFKELGLSEEEQEKIVFQSKLDAIKLNANPTEAFKREKANQRKSIEKLQEELIQLENNLAFFGSSKSNNPLLADANNKIESVRSKVDQHKLRIKLLNITERELNNQQNEAESEKTEA